MQVRSCLVLRSLCTTHSITQRSYSSTLSHHHNRTCSVVLLHALWNMLFVFCGQQTCCKVIRALTTVLYQCMSSATCFIVSQEICHRVKRRQLSLCMAYYAHMPNSSCDTKFIHSMPLHALPCHCMSCHVMSPHQSGVICAAANSPQHITQLTPSTCTLHASAQSCCSCEEA